MSGFDNRGTSINKIDKINTILLIFIFTYHLGYVIYEDAEDISYALEQSRSWIDEWMLGKIVVDALDGLGLEPNSISSFLALIKVLTSYADWYSSIEMGTTSLRVLLNNLFADDAAREFLLINRYKGVLWFNKEAFNELIWWMNITAVVNIIRDENLWVVGDLMDSGEFLNRLERVYSVVKKLKEAARGSDFRVDTLMSGINEN